MTVRDFTERWIVPRQHDYVVVNKGDLAGIVSVEMFRYLPKHAWAQTTLNDVVRSETPRAWPDEPLKRCCTVCPSTRFP